MYYIAPHNRTGGEVTIWRVVKRLGDFKAEDGVEYVVKKNKDSIEMGTTLPIYIGLNGKLKKCSSYALYLF